MPGVCPGGGMSEFRFDRRITHSIRVLKSSFNLLRGKNYQKLEIAEDCMKEFVNSLAYSACEVQK